VSLPKLTAAAALALGSLLAAAAHADTMLAESGVIVGTQALQFSFLAPAAGTINMQLTDLAWPVQFSSLDLSATSTNTVLQSMAGPGDLSFGISSGGTYYAHLMATAQGSLDVGAYSLNISYTPLGVVPLPASAWMLLGGLAMLAAALRHRVVLPLAARG